ncbi:MAG TPA: sterol desaturase family protein [Candidatus Bathyarchaeia archaeon]|nr:sterol desaturase family protein [Candidatus Bathyarchaeia archaeon]
MNVRAASTSGPVDCPATLGGVLACFVRFPSPQILIAATVASLAARISIGGLTPGDALVALAIVAFWPFQEWLIHVFILHYRPVTFLGGSFDFPVPQSHRAHHRDPWDIPLLFIPTHVFLYAIPIQLAFWLLVMPTQALATSGPAVYFFLTLHDEWVHFLVHTRYRPRSRLYDRLWRNHRLHHFKNESYWYGVTMLTGDRLLGTAPEVKLAPTSSTCRTLGETVDTPRYPLRWSAVDDEPPAPGPVGLPRGDLGLGRKQPLRARLRHPVR